MDTARLRSILERIGFNHHESAVYLELLQHGEQPASAIARKTRTPRSTIRSILDKLCSRGVVGKIYRGNTQRYFCLPPDALEGSVRRDIEEQSVRLSLIGESLPLFAAARGEIGVFPKVRYFEGEKGLIEAFNHSLFVEGLEEILFFTSYAFLKSPVVRKNDVEFYVPLRVKKGINMRVLSDRSPEAMAFFAQGKAQLRTHRFLPPGTVPPGNLHIYGDFVTYFSAGEGEAFAMLCESRSMASTLKLMFELLWKQTQ